MSLIVLTDYLGGKVGLTAERRQHILQHPEMVEWIDKLGGVLAYLEWVVRSCFDPPNRSCTTSGRHRPVSDPNSCVLWL
jgi:hypothetical protein